MGTPIVLGPVPDPLTVNIARGAPFVCTIRRADGAEWDPGTVIELRLGETLVWPATVTGTDAVWDLPAGAVAAAVDARRAALWHNGSLWARGYVIVHA